MNDAKTLAERAAAAVIQLRDTTNQTLVVKRAGWADLIEQQAAEIERMRQPVQMVDEPVAYGCHIDLPDSKYDDCVLDMGRPNDCLYARKYGDSARNHCGERNPVAVKRASTSAQAAPAYVPLSEELRAGRPDAPAAIPYVPLSESELEEIVVQEQFLLVCDGMDEFREIARHIESLVVARMRGEYKK